jgi:hypothetical protein
VEPLLGLVAVVAIVVIVAAWLRWRRSQRTTTNRGSRDTALAEARPDFPAEGLLVSAEVLRSAGSSPVAVWRALEVAASPIAVEYYPVTDAQIAKLRTVPVNATAQRALVDLVKTVSPKGPTLFRAVLPEGAELVKAVGADGFRGFSRTGGRTAHAVLTPVAVGGAALAGWPVFAVAAAVTAADVAAQRELRAHQRRVETILGRQEERHYVERITRQKSADAQLTLAISLMLDGHNPQLELARKSADDEFFLAQQFLEKHRGVIDQVADEDGKVDHRRLEEALGGKGKDVDNFIRELHLARAAIAIQRKAIVADAAGRALADPANPYTAFRKSMEAQARELEDAGAMATELAQGLGRIELKGRWRDELTGRWIDSRKSVAARQARLRARVSAPVIGGDADVRYLMTSSGEILQVLPSDDDHEPEQPVRDDAVPEEPADDA